MSTGRERIAAKARQEPTLRCTSLAPPIDAERLWHKLGHVPRQTAPGSDGQTVDDVKQECGAWSAATLRAVPTPGEQPPPVRRTYIPKPGQREPRPLGVPCVGGRGRQRSVARLRRSLAAFHHLRQRMRHASLKEQAEQLHQALRSHYAYDGVAGNLRRLQRFYDNVERYWRQMLSRRSRKGTIRWDVFQQIPRA